MSKTSILHLLGRATLAAATTLALMTPGLAAGFPLLSRQSAPAVSTEGSMFAARLDGKRLPRGARPLTGQELFELYVGKTWRWGEGGGYFGPHGMFRARTYGEKGETNAGGTWAVNDKGRMCFRAVWTNSAGSSKANTCFDHMVLGGDIYQRRVTGGDWYVFRHRVPEERDEFNKLVVENLFGGRTRH